MKLRLRTGSILDHTFIELDGYVGAVSFQLRGLSGHFDLLAGGPDLELAIYALRRYRRTLECSCTPRF